MLSEQVYFKIDYNGTVSSVIGNESTIIDLKPFKKIYFEIPLRVLKIAIRQRMSKFKNYLT